MLCFKIMQEITSCDAAEVSEEVVVTHTPPANAVEEKGNESKESAIYWPCTWMLVLFECFWEQWEIQSQPNGCISSVVVFCSCYQIMHCSQFL